MRRYRSTFFLLIAGCAHVSTPIPENDIQIISGSWIGQLKTLDDPLTTVFRFETNKDGQLEMKVKAISGEFKGQLSGNSLSGNWKQPGGSDTLTLSKK